MFKTRYKVPRPLFCLLCLALSATGNRGIARGINTFSANLYKALSTNENLIFSPFSAHSALSFAYEGAAGDTAQSFRDVLDIPKANVTAQKYKYVMRTLNSARTVTVRIANKIYIKNGYNLNENFRSLAQNYFAADVENIDFNQQKQAADDINAWVSSKTRNKIDKLVDAQSFDSQTRAFLLNAVYFNGEWENPFKTTFTSTGDFHVSETETVQCQMMTEIDFYDYAENAELDAQILKLKYRDQRFAMTIILPKSTNGIAELENKLSTMDITSIETTGREIEIFLPKFKMESTLNMKDHLTRIGLGEIFSDNADFPNIIDDPEKLKIDEVTQKAIIDFNEKGTEVAVVTVRCTLPILLISVVLADPASDVSDGINNFAYKLYNAVSHKNKNLIYSPMSIHTALSFTYQGAVGETAESFRNVLNVPEQADTATAYKKIITSLTNTDKVQLRIANKIYVKNEYKLRESFRAVAQESFDADIEAIDFNDGTNSANNVNQWIRNKTNGKIQELVKADDFNSKTRALLLNAIYFKGNWAKKFPAKNTQDDKFFTSETESINWKMMKQTGHFKYGQIDELDSKILKMHYEDKRYSMVIILPNSRTGLDDLEKKLIDKDINNFTTFPRHVIVTIPKFKLESDLQLKQPLSELGLAHIFSANANFSNMLDSDEPLSVDKVIQKAFVEVNEEGSEAAAATGMLIHFNTCYVSC
ncbi:serine protease inhibitor serpin [Holotrichia oblita]|uniref:Serine protease inhibitor serpin n=1 Tax=Holotrichia oblita TaxID=644536 RepID=A0ACB9SKD3_HOLOL|nr:serine protease inhibitor serpin [Holotrichia oblita]